MVNYLNTYDEVENCGYDTAIIPVGSVEQHSTHLPLGTDFIYAQEMANAVGEILGAYVLPALPISTCYEHRGRRGSVCMRPSTFYTMLQDIILDLKNQGFCKIVVLLGHGGVFVAAPAIREMNALHDDLQVVLASEILDSKVLEIAESKYPEIHAGERETSLMLYLCEESVKKDKMMENDFIPDYPQNFLNHVPLKDISEKGTWGEPSLASKEKGEKLFYAKRDAIVNYIRKAFEVSPAKKW